MTPVFQTIIGKNGNCMQAAYASILDLPLNAVPHFLEGGNTNEGNAKTRVDDFLESLGLAELSFLMVTRDMRTTVLHALEFSPLQHFLMSVPSQLYNGGHCVVGRMDTAEYGVVVAHDPNPRNAPYDLKKTPNLAKLMPRVTERLLARKK